MEAIVLQAIVAELARELPARVHAVLQPSARQILLVLRGAAERRLLISTDPVAPRLHLVGARPALLPAPTAFCRLLRKRLEGCTLAAVACPGVERAVEFSLRCGRGRGPGLLLVAELMGKHSNLVLVDPGTGLVLDSLQHVEPPMSRVRTVVPGAPWTPPPAGGRVPLVELGAAEFSRLWRESGGEPAAVFAKVLGVGPGALALAVGRARLAPGFDADPGAAVHAALLAGAAEAARGASRPVLYPGRGLALPLPVPGWEAEEQREAPTMNAAAEQLYEERLARRAAVRQREALSRELRRALKKLEAEAALRAAEAGAAGEAARLQAAGVALGAAADGVAKGTSLFRFADPDGGAAREVALDPALGPRQNAEALFRRARKVRRRAELAAGKLPGIAARRRLLEEELAVVAALSPAALAERAASSSAPAAGAGRGAARRPSTPPGIREYRSAQGWRILVGKSSAGNDRLTGRVAAPDDYWFHVRDYPGAHVVLKGAGGDPAREAIAAAGAIAAWHSGARTERMVDVAYTRRRNVRKVKGGPQGAVLLGESSTVRVRPGVPDGVEEHTAS